MAKPNYSFEKRQRELAKKKKKEEKDREKAARKAGGLPPLEDNESADDADALAETSTGSGTPPLAAG